MLDLVLYVFLNIRVEALNVLKWELFRNVVISYVLEAFCDVRGAVQHEKCVYCVCFRNLFENRL